MTKKERIIEATKAIIRQYTTRLTVRQIYYRLVSAEIIANRIPEYHYLVQVLANARRENLIPFRAIEDRTRDFFGGDSSYTEPQEMFEYGLDSLRDLPDRYHLPRWLNQPAYVEVWLEKQALYGVFAQALRGLAVTLAPCRGYPSLTFLWEAAERLQAVDSDRAKVVLYFGDYDPSGMDIERAIQAEFARTWSVECEVWRRVAISLDQIREYKIPPMPAKRSDSRAVGFIAEHGDMAVELDAIDPDVLMKLISAAVGEHFDTRIHDETLALEDEKRAELQERIDELKLPKRT